MSPFLPPTRAAVQRNFRLLVEDWRAAPAVARYFIASQFASGILLGACSSGSVAAAFAGLPGPGRLLLGAAALCFVHSVSTWALLKRRFGVRYEVW
jgi:hypothetical protein